jgi:hypothetical protein
MSLALQVIERLCSEYAAGVEVSEQYGEYFRLKIEKGAAGSVGRLFGLIEQMKMEKFISEYSVS